MQSHLSKDADSNKLAPSLALLSQVASRHQLLERKQQKLRATQSY